MPINIENTEKLIEALESGKYKQTKEVLRYGSRRCCLGVACDISGLGRWDRRGGVWIFISKEEEESSEVLPGQVQRWLGWEENNGPDIVNCLSALNDEEGMTFPEIAQVLRKVVEEEKKK